MRHTDIAIVGGGLAGATAAAMLGRAQRRAVLIDPHLAYPSDFRCEKLDDSQVALLEKTGLAGAVLPSATLDDEVWLARFGKLLDRRPTHQRDILYDGLVNAVRGAIQSPAELVHGKVASIATSAGTQTLTLSSGETISARLVVLATGLNTALRNSLGIQRIELSKSHSVSIGFDVKPVGGSSFNFKALTYYPERLANRMAYLTLFPMGSSMRANYFVYRSLRDPWLHALRTAPKQTLLADLKRLVTLTGDFDVVGDVEIRPVDLYAVAGYRQHGVVLVGDAFSSSCPAAGTGVSKVFTDVERLCNVHIPAWLATDGMDKVKISAFYDDPIKQACDSMSLAKAFSLKALSTEPGLLWSLRRLARFAGHFGRGTLRSAKRGFSWRAAGRLQPAVEN